MWPIRVKTRKSVLYFPDGVNSISCNSYLLMFALVNKIILATSLYIHYTVLDAEIKQNDMCIFRK